jgi:ubiquinone/menaquinone biosynthesis C-methylase UbiE
MTQPTGFSDVDGSARAEALVEYLAAVARKVDAMRRQDYERLGLRPGAALLDVGCGAGEVCIALAGRVAPDGRVAGIDASEAMIAAAQKAATAAAVTVDFRVGSIYALPFPDASFDIVRSERVFQHLADPEAGLREILRVTRPGGRVMVIDPDHGQHGLGLDDPAHRRVAEAVRRDFLKAITNPHSGPRLPGMFRRAGLADIETVVRSVEFGQPEYMPALFIDERLAAVVAAGEVTAPEAQAFRAELEARHHAGTFYANAIGYSVAGTRR